MNEHPDKHYFPAANTPYGFYSLFGEIVPEEKARNIIYIKGGSGSGKSTLMKAIAKKARDKGLMCELYHCSSDPDSLDGLFIPENKTAIFDATAPHIMEPKYPGINGEIFNTAEFLNTQELLKHSEDVKALVQKKSELFFSAYNYLKAAKSLYVPETEVNKSEIYSLAKSILGGLKPSEETGVCRRLFLSGITPNGIVDFTELSLKGTIYGVFGNESASALIKEINRIANNNGLNTTIFYCPFSPQNKAEHLIIPELSLSFTTINDFHCAPKIHENIILSETTKSDVKAIRSLINKGCKKMKKAKQIHEKVEKIYSSCMDFDAMASKIPYIQDNLL